jgi:hypothetical protein
MAGAHAPMGICLAAGPQIRPGRFEATNLPDAGASVLAMTGVAAMPEMNGKPWSDSLVLPDDPLAEVSAPVPGTCPSPPAVERELADRLRDLGYIE